MITKRELRRSLLLVDKTQVQRAKISDSRKLKASANKRQLEDFDAAQTMWLEGMLEATGERAYVESSGLNWWKKYVTSDSHSIEDERMMELEMAQWGIVKLTELLKRLAVNLDEDQAEDVSTVVAFTDEVQDRLCWGQTCVRRLAAGETKIGALRAGKDARAKCRSVWHKGRKHTKSIEKMIEAEAKASADAEAK